MRVTGLAPDNRCVTHRDPPPRPRGRFGTTLRTYQGGGKSVTAAAHDASVPAVLAGTVLGVTGLDGMPHYVRTQTLPRGNPRPPAANGSPLPKFDGPHRRYGTCGYLPQQLNGAYGTDTTGYTGRGQTVGIVLWYASATQPADVNRFSRAHD